MGVIVKDEPKKAGVSEILDVGVTFSIYEISKKAQLWKEMCHIVSMVCVSLDF